MLERNILGGSSTGRSAGFLTPDFNRWAKYHQVDRGLRLRVRPEER